ncbi:DUF397 domain-containing protein [Actinomadura violacea]|uniref:DUF397 domain-containing protein n=1 Tax=Actinomadura violacea TaxID=2819934 RepID=A0ABS3S6E7_9ACTN|nr:DUF397 domain-containing protein [Actinomadura violacea]MBO2464328.1 DUF397 domain-containing protein [Actinomadura violacea]
MTINWRKSSYSGGSTDEMCVEVGELVGGVAIRDSNDPDGGRLEVGSAEFAMLLGRIKHGALDRP